MVLLEAVSYLLTIEVAEAKNGVFFLYFSLLRVFIFLLVRLLGHLSHI